MCVCVCLCVYVCGTCVRGFNQLIKFAVVITVILSFGMSQKLFECPNLNGRLVVIWTNIDKLCLEQCLFVRLLTIKCFN